jgi:dynein assembly factor 2
MPDDDDMTQEEVSMLGKAMKKKKFRGLIQEYVDEVTDPNNREEYDQYLNELEAKREMPKGTELLRPEPGVCVLTHLRFPSGQKQEIYINFCHSQYIADVGMEQRGGDGSNVSLPFTMAAPRPDKSPNGDTCMTCDFAVSTMTLARCVEQPQLLKLMVDIAADHLTQNFLKGKEEVLKDFKVTDLKCKGGKPMPMSVKEGTVKREKDRESARVRPSGDVVTPSELRQMKKDARDKMGMNDGQKAEEALDEDEEEVEEEITRIRVPKHRLLHVGSIDWSTFLESSEGHKDHKFREVPKELKLVVELPTVKKVSECDLDVGKDNVVLEVADKFYLDLPLPFEIDTAKSSAKFDKNRTPSELVIVMPVVPKIENLEKPSFAWEEAAANDVDRLDDSEDELPALEEVEEPAKLEEAAEKQPSTPDEAAPAPADAAPEQPSTATGPPEPAPSKAPVRREKLGEDEPEESVVASGADFIAAEAWAGARAGYVFKTGDQGLGYYRDRPFAPPERKAPTPAPAPAPAPAEDFLVVREVRRKPKTELEAVMMGEPEEVAVGQNRMRLWAVLDVAGDLAVDSVDVALRATQVRVQFTVTVDGERHQYEWRRVLKYDVDVRQVHWEQSGRGQRQLIVVLHKEASGSWGDDMFIPIGAGAAAEEAWEDVGEPEVEEESPPEASSAYVPVSDLSEMTDTPDAEVVPESASGDALLGQAIPLETRLFLEVF